MHHWSTKLVETWQKTSARLPRLHRDGFSLPRELLLAQLRKHLDGDDFTVLDLELADDAGLLTLEVLRPAPARLAIRFHFLPVDWARRELVLAYTLKGEARSSSLARRALTGLVLATLEAGWGERLIRKLTEPLAWLSSGSQRLTLHLDRLPRVAGWLERPVFGQPLAERIAITDIRTVPDALRVTLSRNKAG
ncbi:hypothetical protein [Pseudogulbenkiania ferrooxidans]|uniref:Uncharacterized protein n=1 Tax=Pseudogulbenkiania ferrooxidans 2002 TaxID=279714 RepID=B9Z2J7_9NEIS|nr:hypothetical protein [Pseudogulbenkiania ferrooxidans]EEG08800.1 hypothetical protein FuraDRAFT_1560 [Pseudogulbenkiania ferrooxidans 2002]